MRLFTKYCVIFTVCFQHLHGWWCASFLKTITRRHQTLLMWNIAKFCQVDFSPVKDLWRGFSRGVNFVFAAVAAGCHISQLFWQSYSVTTKSDILVTRCNEYYRLFLWWNQDILSHDDATVKDFLRHKMFHYQCEQVTVAGVMLDSHKLQSCRSSPRCINCWF